MFDEVTDRSGCTKHWIEQIFAFNSQHAHSVHLQRTLLGYHSNCRPFSADRAVCSYVLTECHTIHTQHRLPTHRCRFFVFSVRTIAQRRLFQRIHSRIPLCNCIKPVMRYDKFLASISMRSRDNLRRKSSNKDLYFSTIF